MRVVLDANVFMSGLISKQGPPGQILDTWLKGGFMLFVSLPIMAEIQRVLAYPRIRERLKTHFFSVRCHRVGGGQSYS